MKYKIIILFRMLSAKGRLKFYHIYNEVEIYTDEFSYYDTLIKNSKNYEI